MASLEDNAEERFLEPGYFSFPFVPYDIQEQFMKQLYTAIEQKKIGIFESPTGTGKSLSLICGALTWLRDYELKQQKEMDSVVSKSDCTSVEEKVSTSKQACEEEPSWVNEYKEKKAQQEIIERINTKKEQQERVKAKIELLRKQRQFAAAVRTKRKREESSSDVPQASSLSANELETDDDTDLLLNDYSSDLEEKSAIDSSSDSEPEEDNDGSIKVFYCSRTHSQLSQFVSEVKKSPFGKSTKVVALGSRQNYCINSEVQRLRSISSINERCLELQRSKKDKKSSKERPKRRKITGCGCPFYQTKKLHDFVDHVYVDVQDIEQLVELGKDLKTCPYYGSRFAARQAQLVVLPYNTLLHKSTRAAVGIKLKDSVIIVDEAHNLIETINSLHSVEISGPNILTSKQQLSQYLNRYRSRLKAKNLMYINQLLSILNAFIKFLTGTDKVQENKEYVAKTTAKEECSLQTIDDFVFSVKIDNLNLFKIRRYCERSMIAKKLNGFVDKYLQAVGSLQHSDDGDMPKSSQFFHIEAFLEALTNVNKDGRILVTKCDSISGCCMKFLLLNPAVHFTDVIAEARAVIIAGGTMQPVSEFKQVLLRSAGVSSERIMEFSCGHVIPPENLVTIALCKGPSSIDLDFTYQNRDRFNVIEELGRLLVNICTVVPGGIVCFFPSYDYEETVHKRWENSGILQRIESRKKIFREPRKAGVDRVLTNYSQCIKRCSAVKHSEVKKQQTGAVLLSVVGGKMSEGINFSDDLGRCIVMVGMPYPNSNSPELREKMEYLNKTIGPKAGQQHYENICMKAVNQSIGRAIRHRGDHACICLVDQRYSRSSVQAKLPGWIQSRLQVHPRFGPAFASINKFFVDKRSSST
eukprot:gene7330-8151_t